MLMIFKKIRDFEEKFPDAFKEVKHKEFIKSVRGPTFKTGDSIRLEAHVRNTVLNDCVPECTIVVNHMDEIGSSTLSDAICVIVSSNMFTEECLDYYGQIILQYGSSLVLLL